MKLKPTYLSMQHSDPTLHTPQQKLRKISFDASQLDQFPLIVNKKSQQLKVDGWGNENWDFKTQEIINKPKSTKSISRDDNNQRNNVITITKKQNIIANKDTTVQENRTKKYIEKLQEKLVELVEIKSQKNNNLQVTKNQPSTQNSKSSAFNPNYLTPKKPNNQKTTSTSQSQRDNNFTNKYEHNFTSTMYKNSKEKQRSFSIKRKLRDVLSKNQQNFEQMDQLALKDMTQRSIFEESQKKKICMVSTQRKSSQYDSRSFHAKSMLESYEDLVRRNNQVLIIPYPVIDQQRLPGRGPKLNKLKEFFGKFQQRNNGSRHDSNHSKHSSFKSNNSKKLKISQQNQESTIFRIKITGPLLQSKKRPFKMVE